MACLDTTILVDLLRRMCSRRQRALDKILALVHRGEMLVTTRLNVAELYVGVERSDDPDRQERLVRGVLVPLRVLEFGDEAARLFGRITAHLRQIGRPIGDMDALIAATCLTNAHALVTSDVAHFGAIPGLIVESY